MARDDGQALTGVASCQTPVPTPQLPETRFQPEEIWGRGRPRPLGDLKEEAGGDARGPGSDHGLAELTSVQLTKP